MTTIAFPLLNPACTGGSTGEPCIKGTVLGETLWHQSL